MYKTLISIGLLLTMTGCQEPYKIIEINNDEHINFVTDEGTWMNIDVSPDGKSILFDLLGDIYLLPINGGKAEPVRVGMSWDVAPKFSPNGDKIAFVSDFKGGEHQLCIMDTDGNNVKEISHGVGSHGAPTWLNDSTLIDTKYSRGNSPAKQYSIVDSTTKKLPKMTEWWNGPTYSKTDGAIYYSANDKKRVMQIFKLNSDSTPTQITNQESTHCFRPSISNDGKWLAYGSTHKGIINNELGKRSLVLRNLETGVERELVNDIDFVWSGAATKPFDKLPSSAFTPDGRYIIIAYKGKIHSIDVVTGSDKIIPFTVNVSKERTIPNQIKHRISLDTFKVRQIHSPTLHPNGEEVVFTAVGKLWSHNMRNGNTVRLTKSAVKEFTPKFSPDGLKIAYATWSDEMKGSIMIYDIITKTSQNIVNIPGFFINPTWSPNGETLAFIAAFDKDKTYEELSDSETLGIYTISQLHEPAIRIADCKKLETQNLLTYSPLYFDKTGEHLFYSDHGYYNNMLYKINLKNKSTDTVMEVPKTINYISPAPDGSKAILVGNFGLYEFEGLDKLTTVKKLKFDDVYRDQPEVKLLSNSSATIVEWQKDGTLFWNFTNELYKWKPGNTEPTLVSNIDLIIKKRKSETQETVYKNARIITMDDHKVIANGYIKVASGRIKEIGEMATFKSPKDALIIDCSGKTIMPGLIDVHAHFHYYYNNIFTEVKYDYISNLAYGVTTIFDPAAFNDIVFPLEELVESGTIVGPRIFSAGTSIMGNEGNWAYAPINSLMDAKMIVRQLQKSGAIMVKSYWQPRRDQKQWLIKAAKDYGMKITLESGLNQMNFFTGIIDGHNAIEHDPLYMPIYDDVVNFYAKSGVQITTTFGIDNVAPVFFAKEGYVPDRKLERFMDPKRLKKYHSETKVESAMEFIQTAKDLKKVLDQGGKISLGSHGEFAGIAMHWELWLAAMGDWSPMQVLEAATIVGAEKIGYDTEIGSIETGKIADLLILNSNPLDDIRNTADIQYVIKEGVVYDAASMTQLYPEYKTLPKPEWLNEEQWKTYKNPIPFNE